MLLPGLPWAEYDKAMENVDETFLTSEALRRSTIDDLLKCTHNHMQELINKAQDSLISENRKPCPASWVNKREKWIQTDQSFDQCPGNTSFLD